MTSGMVIVGTGEAGTRAATALREQGYDGPVTLIGGEQHLPYERPPLSKRTMEEGDEPALAVIADRERLAAERIEHIMGVAVMSVTPSSKSVTLANGRVLGYERLLLATGARPRKLNLSGADDGNVHYLRTFADAVKLRSRLSAGARITVIGGGFIGLELAAVAAGRGCCVTVLELAPRILGRAVPADIAELVAARHRAAGVEILTGVGIDRITNIDGLHHVVRSDGRTIPSDTIVAGIGAEPETALAEAAALAIENGVRVDGRLVTSDPDILAAGDCCSFPHALFDGRRMRLEAWRAAQEHGEHAARVMLGSSDEYDAVPWFWSDQYELTIQITGMPSDGPITVERPLGSGSVMNFHLAEDGRLVGASAFGVNGSIAKEIRVAEMLIGKRKILGQDTLRDPAIKLKSLLAA